MNTLPNGSYHPVYGSLIMSRNRAVAVTPSDTVDLVQPSTGIYIGGAGNVKVDMVDGSTVTFNALTVGIVHHISVKRVYVTGTTATNIIALY